METREGYDAEFRAKLRIQCSADDLAFWAAQLEARANIAALRAKGYGVSASIQRDAMMTAFEAWVDPGAGVFRAELQAEQRSLAAESARAIDPECGF